MESEKPQSPVVPAIDRESRVAILLSRVPGSADSLYRWLCTLAGELGRARYPGAEAMSQAMRVSRFTIYRAEESLVSLGLVDFLPGEDRHGEYVIRDGNDPSTDEISILQALRDITRARLLIRKPSQKTPENPAENHTKPAAPAADPQPSQAKTPRPHVKKSGDKNSQGPAAENTRDAITEIVCASPKNMALWLLYGKYVLVPHIVQNPGISAEEIAKLNSDLVALNPQPSTNNWRVTDGHVIASYNDMEPVNFEKWTTNQWASYYWFRVSYQRSFEGMPLTQPIWGKLTKTLDRLIKSTPKRQLLDRIHDVCGEFRLIRAMLGGRGQTLSLDETTLANSMVVGTVMNLPPRGSPEREERRAEFVRG